MPQPDSRPASETPQLALERRGSGPRIVMLHGFTQTGRCWGPFADDLAADHELVLIDAPGHGRSGGVAADLTLSAELSGEAGGVGTYLGYSMGGRTALHLALARPELVQRLVLIGATGGLDADAERSDRRIADERLAERIEEIGVEEFIDEWLHQSLFASIPEPVIGRAERATNSAEGLARSLRLCGTGTQRSLWPDLGRLTMPVLVLAGSEDAKFVSLGQRLCESIGGNATFASVPHSGHSTQLENPADTATIIRAWLSI